MDLLFRILLVIIGTLIAKPGYVYPQGGGGLAIGLGGDLMVDTFLGEMPNPLLASALSPPVSHGSTAGGSNVFDQHSGATLGNTGGSVDAANIFLNLFGSASAPVLFPGTHTNSVLNSPVVFLPSSIGISDSQHHTITTANTHAQRSQAPRYHMQNEAFTALGNVGHLVRVPVGQSISPLATVQLTELNEPKQVSMINTTLAAVPTSKTHILPLSTKDVAPMQPTKQAVSITGEPVAMFNPGTGMVSEMAVLHSSLAGERVDMSGFAPPPFSSKSNLTLVKTTHKSPTTTKMLLVNPYITESKHATNSITVNTMPSLTQTLLQTSSGKDNSNTVNIMEPFLSTINTTTSGQTSSVHYETNNSPQTASNMHYVTGNVKQMDTLSTSIKQSAIKTTETILNPSYSSSTSYPHAVDNTQRIYNIHSLDHPSQTQFPTPNSYDIFTTTTTQSPSLPTEDTVTQGPATGAFLESPTRTKQQSNLIADTSKFISDAAREVKARGDPNYITLMGNVVGVIGSKELSTLQHSGISSDLSSLSPTTNQAFASGSVPGVLLGTNGAPITNMAGIRIPTMNSSPNQLNLGVVSPFSTFVNTGSNQGIQTSSLHQSTTDPHEQLASGSFIIGAGQPNARVVKSSFVPQSASPTSANTGFGMSISQPNNQGFALDLSAFTPPSYEIPSVNISSLNRDMSGLASLSSFQNTYNNINVGTTKPPVQTVNDLPAKPLTSMPQQASPTPTIAAAIEKQQMATNNLVASSTNVLNNNPNKIHSLQQPAAIPANTLETLSNERRAQEIINVEPGFGNTLFATRNHRNIQTLDTTRNALPSINRNRIDISNLINSQQPRRHQVHKKPVVGSIFGERNDKPHVTVPPSVLQQARVSSTPAVDFMQSFLNDRKLNSFNVPMPTLKDTSAPVLNARDAKNVNQFGVAEIYTRTQKLNQSQWNDLLSSMNRPRATRPDNIQYQTLNVVGASETKPFMQNELNSFQTKFVPQTENKIANTILTPRRVRLNSGIRTTFEAPGMNRFNKKGYRNSMNVPSASTISSNSNKAVGVPERSEFVQPNPSTDKSTAPALAGTIQMPMFQQLGIQKNLVSAPNSGSTREFNPVASNSINPNINVQPTSAVSPQKVFTIGQSINLGDSLPSLDQQSIFSGAPISTNSMNLNQFASTGLRLGQPVAKNTFDNQAPIGNMNSLDMMSTGTQTQPATQFTSGNREAVFGNTGPNTGRTLATKTQLTQTQFTQKTPGAAAVLCKYRADPTSKHHFYLQLRSFRHRFRCALGTAFDIETCECSTRVHSPSDCLEVHMDFNNGIVEDSSINRLPIGNENVEVTNKSTPLTGIALFGEKSKLTIWRYQNYDFRDHVMLKVQFRPGPGGSRFQPLIANCDGTGGGPSIGIIYDKQMNEVLLMLKTENDTGKELKFPVNPNEWNDVTYIYDGQEFIGIVNGVRRYVSRQDPHLLGIIGGEIKSLPTQGIIEIRDAALVLGFCPRYGHYVGAMVDIQVYTCIPRDFRLE